MSEVDDRLFGDPVWELFADPIVEGKGRLANYQGWLIVAGLVVLIWLMSPALAVFIAALSVGYPDLRRGRELARSIPEKAGGTICSRFTYGWGVWKVGVAAFLLMILSIYVGQATDRTRIRKDVPPEFPLGLMLWTGSFFLSAILTAMGLLASYRSGMRIWIGRGVNQARTLLLSMLLAAFVLSVLIPMIWIIFLVLPGNEPMPAGGPVPLRILSVIGAIFILMLGGPVLLLIILDRISRNIVADTPGKFGPKVPTVGKWNS